MKCSRARRPDIVLVQGDTTTVMVASLAAFYHRVPVGHVEAGLRTLDRYSPFPEEINRRLVSHLASLHFAPTNWSRDNLLKEGIPRQRIIVTGNTVIDALLETRDRVVRRPPAIAQLRGLKLDGRKLIVVTAHRRENFGPGLTSICQGILRLVSQREDIEIVFPVHPNPNVQAIVRPMLGGINRIHLIDPLDYPQFVWLLNSSLSRPQRLRRHPGRNAIPGTARAGDAREYGAPGGGEGRSVQAGGHLCRCHLPHRHPPPR